MGRPGVEGIYRLSPQQRGMFFESLRTVSDGRYVEQNVYELNGISNLNAFDRAWQRIIDRHAVLRTAFVWKNVDEPLQVVLQNAEAASTQHDWRELSSVEQQRRFENFLTADRRQGFELTKAPLMRLSLIRVGESRYYFVWTLHHIVMDGWCLPIIVDEFSSFYQAFCEGRDLDLAPARPYSDYLKWLKLQDLRRAETFWRRELEQFTHPTALGITAGPIKPVNGEASYITLEANLNAGVTAALLEEVRQHRLTMSTLVCGAWSLLLARFSGQDDLVIGTTVSGRPAELSGIERMIGLFINTLPCRVKISHDASLWSWLEELQNKQIELRHYEYCSAGQIHQWSSMSPTLPLYESLLVYENYPTPANSPAVNRAGENGSNYRFTGGHTGFPLTLLISLKDELVVKAIAGGARFERASVTLLLDHYLNLLTAIASDPDPQIASLVSHIPADQIPAYHTVQVNGPSSNGDFCAPGNETEQIIATLAAEVLGLERISINDNFFSLGGHSLVVTQLLSRVRDAFQLELPLHDLFEEPTVAGWARTIDALRWVAHGPPQHSASENYEEGEL